MERNRLEWRGGTQSDRVAAGGWKRRGGSLEGISNNLRESEERVAALVRVVAVV